MRLNLFFLFSVFFGCQSLIAGGRIPKATGTISGQVIHESGKSFHNCLIIFDTKKYQFIDEKDNRFILENVRARKGVNLEIAAHDPILGDYRKLITNVLIKPLEINALGKITLTETDRTAQSSRFFNYPLNQEIIIDDFPFKGFEKPLGTTKDIVIYEKLSWQTLIHQFGVHILEEYKKPYLQQQHIAIIGFASADEKTETDKELMELALARAKFVRDFFYENFNVPRKLFIVGVGDIIKARRKERKEKSLLKTGTGGLKSGFLAVFKPRIFPNSENQLLLSGSLIGMWRSAILN